MIIGVPKEIKTDEHRVALTPAGVQEFTSHGHQVLIEKGAGEGSSIADASYEATGATMANHVDDVWARSDLIMKVKEPIRGWPRDPIRSCSRISTSPHLGPAPTR